MATITTTAEIQWDDEQECWAVHLGGIGKPVAFSTQRKVLEDFLEYLKTRSGTLPLHAADQQGTLPDSSDLAGGFESLRLR